MNIFRVSFIGHREIEDHCETEEVLLSILAEILRRKEFTEFYIGRNGEFDVLAASCIKRAQNIYGKQNSAMTLVLPYPVSDMEYYEDYYDGIYIPEELKGIHYKSVITERNKWLADRCDMLIAYVKRSSGGAYFTLKYAEKNNKSVINIARDNGRSGDGI